jgi:hypothetical protein
LKRIAEALPVSHFGERLAIFNSFADGLGRITERGIANTSKSSGMVSSGLTSVNPIKANPIRPHSFRPRRQQHRLNRAASIRNRKRRPLNHHDNCQRCLRDVWAGFRQYAELPQAVAVFDEMKCHGCLFMLLPVNRPASTIRWMVSDGIGLSWNSRIANSVHTASKTFMARPF